MSEERVMLTYTSRGDVSAMLQRLETVEMTERGPRYHWINVRPLLVERHEDGRVIVQWREKVAPEGAMHEPV